MTRLHLTASVAVLALLTGCAVPDLSSDITQTRTMLANTLRDVKPELDKDAAEDLRKAELVAAMAGRKILLLPGTCVARISGGPEYDVSDCTLRAVATPLDGPANATQLRAAFVSIARYFGALEALAVSRTADEVKTNATGLLSALGTLKSTGNSERLAKFTALAKRDEPALSAIAEFAVEQQRIVALRRIMIAADPVLEEIVMAAQDVLTELGDTSLAQRTDVLDAVEAYDKAHLSGSANRQLAAAKVLRARIKAMHVSEAKSPIRRLFIARQMHGAMLGRLLNAPDLDQLLTLSTQIADINTLLENRK